MGSVPSSTQAKPAEFYTRKASGFVRQLSGKDMVVYNLLYMGNMWPFIYIVFGPALFPGVNFPLTVVIATPIVAVMAFAYYFFMAAMPRSGGDYVWVSRAIGPLTGFAESFVLMMIMIQFIGVLGGWAIDPSLRGIVIVWGILTNNPNLITQINNFLTPWTEFVLTSVVVVITCLVTALSVSAIRRFMWGCFIVGMIGLIDYWGVMLAMGHDGFVARFNALSGANYAAIIQSAQSGGYFTGFALSATFLGTIYAFQNFFGFAWNGYMGGEVKDVTRSQAVGTFGSTLILGAITWVTYEVAYVVAGSDFIHSLSFLFGTGANPLPMMPYQGYLVVFATSNPILALLPGIGFMAGCFGVVVSILLMVTRAMFAWSFDRILPARISELDQRFHAPRNALIVLFVVGMAFAYLYFNTTLLNYLTYGSLGIWAPQILVGLAAAIFPYRRKDIFEKAPKVVQSKLGGVPWMTIFGVFTMLTAVFNTIIAVLPVYTGAPVNPFYLLAFLATALAGPVIYAGAYLYNRRMGIDMGTAFRELPPA